MAAHLADGLGIDVGSTTVKVVAASGGQLVYQAYRRHRGRWLEEARALIAAAPTGGVRIVTGSAGPALAAALDASYVHEVHAVAAAVRDALPGVRTVIELGGQDAKMIHLDEAGRFASDMNERCAAPRGRGPCSIAACTGSGWRRAPCRPSSCRRRCRWSRRSAESSRRPIWSPW